MDFNEFMDSEEGQEIKAWIIEQFNQNPNIEPENLYDELERRLGEAGVTCDCYNCARKRGEFDFDPERLAELLEKEYSDSYLWSITRNILSHVLELDMDGAIDLLMSKLASTAGTFYFQGVKDAMSGHAEYRPLDPDAVKPAISPDELRALFEDEPED